MADKIESTKKDEPGSSELDALLPEREMTINGENIIIRAFNLRDTLKVMLFIKPLLDDLSQLLSQSEPVFADDVMNVLYTHHTITEQLIAHSTQKSVDWVASLSPSDGLTLFDLFWIANRDFFIDAARRQFYYLNARAATKPE